MTDAWSRFEKFVSPEPNSGCWLWTGSTNQYGYGRFNAGKEKLVCSHRFSYERFKGPISAGLDLDHLCRIPCCVNPDHLEPVTRKENVRRSPYFGEKKIRCRSGHTEFSLYQDKIGSWRCRECDKERDKRRRIRRGL